MRPIPLAVAAFVTTLTFLVTPCGAQTNKAREVHEGSQDESKTITVQLDQKPQKERMGTTLDWVEALTAFIHTLVWPAVVITFLYMYRPQLRNLIDKRLKSAKFLGMRVDVFGVSDTEEFVRKKQEIGIIPTVNGNPDLIQLLCQVAAPDMKKSTKVINMPKGCVVLISTREVDERGQVHLAEAAAYVPGVNVEIQRDNKKAILDTRFFEV